MIAKMFVRQPDLLYRAAAITVMAVTFLTGCRQQKSASGGPPPPAVSVAYPIAQKVKEWDDFTGRLASPHTVEIRARVSGYLDKVHFVEGAEVKQGDLLFTIDPRPYQVVVDRLEADLSGARNRALLASKEAERGESLMASKTIAADQYDTRVKAKAEAADMVRSAEAAVAAAKLELEFTEVRAPITGRISDARVTSGNLVTGGATNATMLTSIVSLDPLYCYIEVDERSSLKYRELYRQGKRPSALFEKVPAWMGLATEQGYPHEGFLDFVDNQINPTTGSIRARGVFPNTDHMMAPGFFARVRIPGSGEYDAVLVRDSAIGSDQGRSFVYVVGEDQKAVYRPVTLGPIQDGLRIVREGLKAEERIVVSGLMTARPGSPVAPQVVDMRPAANTALAPTK